MPMIWGVVRAFLDEKTARKVTMIGSNYLKTLTDEIDQDQIPSFIQGNCDCVEFGKPCLLSDIGPWQDYRMLNPKGIQHKS